MIKGMTILDTDTQNAIEAAIAFYGPYNFLEALGKIMEQTANTDLLSSASEKIECKAMAQRINQIVLTFADFHTED
jgi:hypothetical protein